MAGYWLRPDLTGAAIVERDGRWYRTGDLVVRRAAGDLVFLGRADHQVKIRGQRIEIEAVESALLDTDGVSQCGVVVDRAGADVRLIAAVVLDPHAPSDTTTIGRRLAARVPGASVPAAIIAVDTLPRTASGKIDRTALLAELAQRTAADGDGSTPSREHESTPS
jgi:enterobactin synthetase component F